MTPKSSRSVPVLVATLLVVSVAFLGMMLTQPAEASHGECNPPDQRTTFGCCSACNVVKAIYWHCNESHQWEQSGSACLWGQCCDPSVPCCT